MLVVRIACFPNRAWCLFIPAVGPQRPARFIKKENIYLYESSEHSESYEVNQTKGLVRSLSVFCHVLLDAKNEKKEGRNAFETVGILSKSSFRPLSGRLQGPVNCSLWFSVIVSFYCQQYKSKYNNLDLCKFKTRCTELFLTENYPLQLENVRN